MSFLAILEMELHAVQNRSNVNKRQLGVQKIQVRAILASPNQSVVLLDFGNESRGFLMLWRHLHWQIYHQ